MVELSSDDPFSSLLGDGRIKRLIRRARGEKVESLERHREGRNF